MFPLKDNYLTSRRFYEICGVENYSVSLGTQYTML